MGTTLPTTPQNSQTTESKINDDIWLPEDLEDVLELFRVNEGYPSRKEALRAIASELDSSVKPKIMEYLQKNLNGRVT